MKHQRAIEELEKEERRQQILSAAAALLVENNFEHISIQAVARACGLAKGTVYLYFETKEELFLAVLEAEFAAWFGDLQVRLVGAQPALPEQIGPFVQALTASLASAPRLLQLLPILHPILERNLSYPAALAFKRQLLQYLQESGAGMEKIFDFLRPGQGADILLNAYAQLVGLQSMAYASPVVQRILEEPDMVLFRVDVLDALARVVTHMLRGYSIENRRMV